MGSDSDRPLGAPLGREPVLKDHRDIEFLFDRHRSKRRINNTSWILGDPRANREEDGALNRRQDVDDGKRRNGAFHREKKR